MQRHADNRPGTAAATGDGGRSSPPQPRTRAQRLAWTLLYLLLQRQLIYFSAPLIYIYGMLRPLEAVPHIIADAPLGSVYNSLLLYDRLRRDMVTDNSPSGGLANVWKISYKGAEWRPCINTTTKGLPDPIGYIYVEANGGLNQQRTSVICDAVAVAGYLNASLVLPYLKYHPIWKDPSKFKDIYDEDHFITTLKHDVQVVSKVPEFIMERFGHDMSNVFKFKIKASSSIQYYKDAVLPKLVEEKLIRISPFANRLSVDAPSTVQHLRCLANFEALRFSLPIATMAEKLVLRMKARSVDNDGRYIAVHLRFEKDMVAYSCCIYDGGEQERQDMNVARETGWKGKFTRRGRVIQPGVNRINGTCPLTPLEVGLMLRGMGFKNNMPIYLASGKIYNAEKTMRPLLEMFPLLQTKEMLASADELAPFKNYSSRMAAIDYSVCLHSEVFVTTQGGNFAHFVIGHRRYLYGGHSKTIKPDKRKWMDFKHQLLDMLDHCDAKGIVMRSRNGSIYTYPCPDCMCLSNRPEVLKTLAA